MINLINSKILKPKSNILTKITVYCPTSHTEQVKNALFDSGKANARSADNKGWTPLMIASKFGLNEQVEKLLTYPKLYMEIDLKEFEHGCTALMLAAKEGHYDTCETLLKKRASKTKLDFNGMNAMNWAIMFGRSIKHEQQALVAMLHPRIPFEPRVIKKKGSDDEEEEAVVEEEGGGDGGEKK